MNSKPYIRTDTMPAKLEVQMSWWAISGLGVDNREWELEERFLRIAEAGFDGINGSLPAVEQTEQWKRLLDQYGLSFSVNAYPKSISDMARFLKQAEAYGGSIQFINAQVLTPFLTGQSAEKLLHGINDLACEAGIPVFIETHRGTITQDLLRTVDYTKKLDFLRLTIDFSHYVLAGEMRNISDEAEALLQTLLARTASIHARLSNGEQIQVDIGEHGEHAMLAHYERWWKSGMSRWLNSAAAGDIFPLVCELGPPPYAITFDGCRPGSIGGPEPDGKENPGPGSSINCRYGTSRNEMSERWKQSLLFAKIARAIWAQLI